MGFGQLLEALAEQDVIPILAIEGTALEEPVIHRRREAMLDGALRDAQVGPDEATQRLAPPPLALTIAVAQTIGQLRREFDESIIQIRIAHFERVSHR